MLGWAVEKKASSEATAMIQVTDGSAWTQLVDTERINIEGKVDSSY